jgi:hypothetical protein
LRRQLAERLAILPGKPAELGEAVGQRDVGDVGVVPGGEQLLARVRQPRFPHPAHRRGAEMKLELRLQRARADARCCGELVEHDRLVQPAVQPVQRVPEAGRQAWPRLRRETVIYWKARLRAHRATPSVH